MKEVNYDEYRNINPKSIEIDYNYINSNLDLFVKLEKLFDPFIL